MFAGVYSIGLFLLVGRAAVGAPVVATNGVAGAADNQSAYVHGIAPGSLATAYGTGLAASATTAQVPLPMGMNGVRVLVTTDGAKQVAAPLVYVSPGQVNFVIPSQVGIGDRRVVVEVDGIPSNATDISVVKGRFSASTSTVRSRRPLSG